LGELRPCQPRHGCGRARMPCSDCPRQSCARHFPGTGCAPGSAADFRARMSPGHPVRDIGARAAPGSPARDIRARLSPGSPARDIRARLSPGSPARDIRARLSPGQAARPALRPTFVLGCPPDILRAKVPKVRSDGAFFALHAGVSVMAARTAGKAARASAWGSASPRCSQGRAKRLGSSRASSHISMRSLGTRRSATRCPSS
jgi:hypothetical protein